MGHTDRAKCNYVEGKNDHLFLASRGKATHSLYVVVPIPESRATISRTALLNSWGHGVSADLVSHLPQYVLLSGGLGNQLFQLALANYLGSGKEARVLSVGGERQHVPGRPDLTGFALNSKVKILQLPGIHKARVAHKVLSTLQVRGARRTEFDKPGGSALDKALRVTGQILLRTDLQVGAIQASRGIGFDPSLNPHQAPSVSVGYVQSYRYTNSRSMMQILGGPTPANSCSWFQQMKAIASNTRVLAVHLRIGDYKYHPAIGIPDSQYYQEAIELAMSVVYPDEVWAFTDDPEPATRILSDLRVGIPVRRLDPPPNCSHPATVLSVMSLAQGFVLTNSTFGYWAARLSNAEPENVFVPDPWFPEAAPFRDFIPPLWTKIHRSD